MAKRRKLSILAGALLALGAATAVWAYFTAIGSGTGSASISTLASPSPVTATSPSTATAHVTWATVPAPSGTQADVTYVVTRSSNGGTSFGASSGTCAGTLPGSATSCDDSLTTTGDYIYRVTAAFATWTSSGTSNSVHVDTDLNAPSLVSLVMQDLNGNGKVDRVVAVFSETLASYTAGTAPWTIANVPSGGSLSSVSVSGTTATLTITEGVGAADTAVGSFTVALAANPDGIRDGAGNQSSFAATAPSDAATPARTAMTMLDVDASGRVDQVLVTFSETLAAYTAGNAPWTLTNVPSGGSLSSVSVSGGTATLTLAEGAGSANTAVGSFTVALAANANGIRDASNLSAFAATAPADGAAPGRCAGGCGATMTMRDANGNGKVDQVTMTFSETLAAYSAGTTPWTLANVPSGGSLASVAVAGSGATLTLNEGAGAADTTVGSFTVALAANAGGIRDATGNQTSFAAAAPADGAAPARTAMTMLDVNVNGKIDRVTVTFSETLASYSAGTTPWTLANVPSSGTLASVSVATNIATLTVTEGAGASDTAVGSFTVALAANAAGIRDAAPNLSSFAAQAPTDGAGPVIVSVTVTDGDGKLEAADTIALTFSEALAAGSVPSSVTVSESDPPGIGFDTLSIGGIVSGNSGSDAYVSGNNKTASFASSGVALSDGNKTITVTVGATCTGDCANLIAAGPAAMTFTPAAAITDGTPNPAAGSFTTATSFKLF
jgi:hypothetical protein